MNLGKLINFEVVEILDSKGWREIPEDLTL